jgi:DNA-binding MarR family transcriptional regulator
MSGPKPAAGQEAAAITQSDPARQRLRVWLRLLKTQRAIEAELRERLRVEFDTTLPRFDVLAALHRAEKGLKMTALSTALKVSNGNVTGIVERLVQDGLVMRVSVEGDRRAMLVRLTHRGREEFARMAATHAGWVDAMLADLGPQEAGTLIALLDTIDIRKG